MSGLTQARATRDAADADNLSATPMVAFEGVTKHFPARGKDVAAFAALDGIDFSVARGSITGIIGRSGAGKSTLIRLVNGLERPTAGKVIVDGVDVGALDEGGLRDAAPLGRHDLPALQPAVFAHRLRQRRAAARDRRRRPASRSASAWRRCSTSSACATSATAIRPSFPAARSSASASPGRSPPSPSSCFPTRRPRRSIRRPRRSILALLTRNQRRARPDRPAHHPRDGGGQGDRRRCRGDRARPDRRGGRTFDVFTHPQHPTTTRAAVGRASAREVPDSIRATCNAAAIAGATRARAAHLLRRHSDPAADCRSWSTALGADVNILAGAIDEIAGEPFGIAGRRLSGRCRTARRRAKRFYRRPVSLTEVLGYVA